MEVAPLPSNVRAADVPLEQIAKNEHLTEEQKTAEVCRQFEAVLLRQILQESQKTVIPSKYSDNSTAGGIYRDMITQQMADGISKAGTLGFAKSLQRQLTRQVGAGPKPPAASQTSGHPMDRTGGNSGPGGLLNSQPGRLRHVTQASAPASSGSVPAASSKVSSAAEVRLARAAHPEFPKDLNHERIVTKPR